MLRHTFATQLLNVGCRVTSIQALMGHTDLDTTLVYARAYDATVASDYFKAMAVIEQRLSLPELVNNVWKNGQEPLEAAPAARDELLRCVAALRASNLDKSQRQWLDALHGGILAFVGAGGESSLQNADVCGGPLVPAPSAATM